MQQDPHEFEQLLSLLETARPRRILEIGVFGGGTFRRFEQRFPEAVVVGIDPDPKLDLPGRIAVGRSQDPWTRVTALTLLGGRPDFLHIDGDHSEAGAQADVDWAVEMDVPLVALHDITLTVAVWDRIKTAAGNVTYEFVVNGGEWGIGVWDRRQR